MCARQSPADRRARTMYPLLLLSVLLLAHAHHISAAIVDPPSLSDRLDQLYEKLEKFSPKTEIFENLYELDKLSTERPVEKLYEKLDRLNSLTPDKFLSEDDEELLDAMQEWGMPDEQIGEVAKEMQLMKPEADGEYGDWNDEDLQDLTDDDYAMDGIEELDPEEEEGTTAKTLKTLKVVEPSALSRLDAGMSRLDAGLSRLDAGMVVSAVDPIEATKERPKILDDSALTKMERATLRRAAIANMASVVQHSKCLTPQPRWLSVRQLAPAADTLYMPPCVQLHRCAPDAGCCYSESEVCAPVDGQYVVIPFFLSKVDGTLALARMQFFNHTRCECVSRETLQATRVQPRRDIQERDQDSQGHSQESTQESTGSAGNARQSDWPTQEPRLDNETTAPPQLRRCTCPILFTARMTDSGCSCVCDWSDPSRRRDCLSLARGREHFGLRDRVCVARGDCHPPSCHFGAYEKNVGRCPLKRYRRLRFTRRFGEKSVV